MDVVAALIPPVGVALIFWYLVRAMIHADRRERTAMARLEMQEKAEAENRRGE
jgi:hypothetical protein